MNNTIPPTICNDRRAQNIRSAVSAFGNFIGTLLIDLDQEEQEENFAGLEDYRLSKVET